MMDWKDLLAQLKTDPLLPQGEDIVEKPQVEKPKKKDRLNVVVEKKGRGGKVATIIEGFTIPDEEVAELAATLKKKLGVGGSARGGEILIQGNIADKVKDQLRQLGYKL